MAEKFSLKDHLFNAQSLGDLAREYEAGVAGFSAQTFLDEVLPKLPALELMARIEAMADGIEAQLAPDFSTMADQIEAAMVPPLDASLSDDDFGRFIHSVPGVLAVRHGLEPDPTRALDLLYQATQRFSMEFYIRAFLNRWPEETMTRMAAWAGDTNYHVRRLVSEGTRPKLPWARAITLDPMAPLPLLERLHADPTRFVTRSVANHLNDIAKIAPDTVVETLTRWRDLGQQDAKELEWMTRHALRTLIKQGHAGALALLGYTRDVPVHLASLTVQEPEVPRGAALEFAFELTADRRSPVLVDYVISFAKADGRLSPKTFKLKQGVASPNKPFVAKKTHKFKWDATTFKLFPGAHRLAIQVNGVIKGTVDFTLL